MDQIGDQAGDLDEWQSFRDLFHRKRSPNNAPQAALLLAWDAIELVHGDGFEALVEQPVPLERYAAALTEVGMIEAAPVVMRVQELLGSAPRENCDAFWGVVREHFDGLRRLAEEFWDKTLNSDEVLHRYVRNRPEEFAEYLPGTASST